MDAKEQLKGMGFTDEQINAAWEAQGKWGLEAMTNFILTNPDAKTPSVSSGTTTEQTNTPSAPSEESKESKEERAKKLQERLNEKRREREAQEKKEALEKEIRRRKAGQEVNQMKEDLKMRELQKQVEQRKREKQEDKLARERVRRQIEQDRMERKAQAQQKKSQEAVASTSVTQQVQAKPSAAEARIQITCPDGSKLVQTFKSTEQLSAVRLFVMMNRKDNHDPTLQYGFRSVYPNKTYAEEDYEKQLKDLGLTPSAALHVTKPSIQM